MTMKLDPNQLHAANTDSSNAVVVAGPGSGKTEVLVQRVRHIKTVDPAAVIAVVTLTNSAADEIRARLGPEVKLWHCGTIHGLALKIVVRSYAREESDVTVLSAEEGELLDKEAMRRVGYKGSKKAFDDGKLLLLETGILASSPRDLRLALLSWWELQRSNLAFTFDGLIYGACEGLKVRKTGICHLIVDEAQDCCISDYRLFDILNPKNRFLVGDPDQNIFAWRGSSVNQFMDHASHADEIRLESNYRCPRMVCEAANNLIAYNQNRIQKRTVQSGFRTGAVALRRFDTFAEEMLWLAEQIQVRSESMTFAVLCRSNLVAGMVREAIGEIPDESQLLPQDWAKARVLLTFLAAPMNTWNAAKAARLVYHDKELKALTRDAQAQVIRKTYGDLTKAITWETALDWLGDLDISPDSLYRIRAAIDGRGPTAEWLVKLDQMQVRGYSEVMTIHAAKGLEFDAVFLPCFDADEMPGRTEIEEARRLAFVALTRAKVMVAISYSRKRKTWGGKILETGPSPFIAEMGIQS